MKAWRNGTAFERKATAIARDMPLGMLVERAGALTAPLEWDFVMRR
jgi:hypothetical protein